MKFILILLTPLIYSLQSFAQVPALPAMQIETQNAQNKITWNLQYDGVKSIAIQRSSDSVKNFTAIDIINSPKKGISSYVDQHPLIGKNFYRLSIEFVGDINWSSNIYKVILDSATIAKSLEGKINSGITNAKSNGNLFNNSPNSTGTQSTDFYFTPSTHIYTNPYTGHININLQDVASKKYNVRFLDPDKKEILKISRINKSLLILDKNNFNAKGTYKFELNDGQTLVETGFVTIY